MNLPAQQPQPGRTIVVHCHIFKNAGTSLDWALRRYFGEAFLEHRDDKAMQQGASYLGPLLEARPGLRALSSHRIVLPLPQVAGAGLLPAFMIRDPIERAYSVYQFERIQASSTPGARMAKKLGFREYVTWRLGPSAPAVINNFQTRYCAGLLTSSKDRLDEDDLDAAKRTLQSTPLAGVVEMFDESMVVFEDALRPEFPDIDLAYVRQNAIEEVRAASPGLFATWFSRLKTRGGAHEDQPPPGNRAAVLKLLGQDLAGRLVASNALDAGLHEWSVALLRSRLEQLPSRDRQLRDFRQRCAGLAGAAGASADTSLQVSRQ